LLWTICFFGFYLLFLVVMQLLVRGWFHQCFTNSFWVWRSHKRKKTLTTWLSFALLGSALIKALYENVGEIDTRFNFTNVLWAAFTNKDTKSAKDTDNLTVFLCFWDLNLLNIFKNMLVKLTRDLDTDDDAIKNKMK